MKIFKESWKSSEGDREDHYYLDKGRKIYLFGINPKILQKRDGKMLFLILKTIIKYVDKL